MNYPRDLAVKYHYEHNFGKCVVSQICNKPGRACVTDWKSGSDWEVCAHEFGHMIGAGDQYNTSTGCPYKDILSVMNNDKLETLIPEDYEFIAEKLGKDCKVCK